MADTILRARDVPYVDLDFAFRANPVTGDVSLKKHEEAVKQSVLNILLTNRGERPFEPLFGSNIREQLFENFDPIIAQLIDSEIRISLENYEPRIRLINVDVDGSPDTNSLDITVEFEILSPEIVRTSVQFSVERLR